jgi:hypothetical protein
MNLAYELDGTEWMEEVAHDLMAFLADTNAEVFDTMVAPANDNDVVVFHGDVAPAMVWVPKFMTVE